MIGPMHNSLLLALAVGATAFASHSGATAQAVAPLVEAPAGKLEGTQADGIRAFKGIPFAQPPVAKLRWRAPVPAARWDGVRKAKTFGKSCLQPPPNPASVYYGGALATSEDCLTLNIWSAVGTTRAPVMVWIHGGGLSGGSSAEPLYDGSKLAQKGIIVVSINYRLGLMGYLAHPTLSADSPDKLSGNYGLLDQIAALHWVRDNIAAFGGDPGQVTIAGESAGALSVIALLASPKAHGLFHRAISQSGYMPAYRALNRPALGLASAEDAGVALTKAAGVSDKGLRSADPIALFQAGLATGWAPEPVIDGVTLPHQLAVTFGRGAQATVPVLAGFNEGEIRSLLFLAPKTPGSQAAYQADVRARFGDKAEAFLAVYPGTDPREDGMNAMRDGLYGWAAQYVARAQAAAGQPAYLYCFRHSTPAQHKRDLAAFHASEIPYAFGHVGPGAPIGPNWPKPPETAQEAALTDAMLNYWAAFVRTGVPSAPASPAWPRYTLIDRAYLDIVDTPVAKTDLQPAAFAWADGLVADRWKAGRSWRFDIGFNAFPVPVKVDAPTAGGQPKTP